jgi:hypothetical protein
VFVSSDTWPGTGGVLGLTKAQIAEAKAKGIQPAGGAGFPYQIRDCHFSLTSTLHLSGVAYWHLIDE